MLTAKYRELFEEGRCLWCGAEDANDMYVRTDKVRSLSTDELALSNEDKLRFCDVTCARLYFTEP